MFAERLKEARKAKRYSQAEVSKMLGVTQQAVGKWETGRSTPDPQTVARLAEILDTPSDVLLGLQARGAGRPGFQIDEEKRKDPRELELKILKNRSAALGQPISLRYYPAFSCFMEG